MITKGRREGAHTERNCRGGRAERRCPVRAVKRSPSERIARTAKPFVVRCASVVIADGARWRPALVGAKVQRNNSRRGALKSLLFPGIPLVVPHAPRVRAASTSKIIITN